MPDETSKRCVPFHPWMIGKFKKSPISAAQCLLAAAEDSHECFIRMLANVNEAFPLPVAEIGQTNAKCEAGNIEAPKDAPSHKSLANFEVAAPLEGTPEITIEETERLIRKMEKCEGMPAKLLLMKHFAERVSKASREELRQIDFKILGYYGRFVSVGKVLEDLGKAERMQLAERELAEIRSKP